jgi:hypothetical protein
MFSNGQKIKNGSYFSSGEREHHSEYNFQYIKNSLLVSEFFCCIYVVSKANALIIYFA